MTQLTKLAPDELIAMQLVLVPTLPREATAIRGKIMNGREPKLGSKKPLQILGRLILLVVTLAVGLLRAVLETIGEMTRPSYSVPNKQYLPPAQQIYAPSPAAKALYDLFEDKLAQPLFQANLRVLVETDKPEHAKQRLSGVSASLSSFKVPGYQALVAKRGLLRRFRRARNLESFTKRLPSPFLRQACVLAVSEVAAVYHFPYGDTTNTENMSRSRSRTLPAPAELKNRADNRDYDVVVGENRHHGSTTVIGLTAAERERHVYVLGGTGNGKTTMLLYSIVQDIRGGKGVAVIDPHGDLAETLLRHIPKRRINDVVYFNPRDIEYPIGLNVLELSSKVSGDELLLEQDFVTESVVSLFRKIFSEDDSGGHRIEYILRNAIHTAFTTEQPTLFTVYRLLTDTDYRKSITSKLEDTDLKNFWVNEYGQAGGMQRVKMSGGVTSKVSRFQRSASARRVLEQPRSTIDFDEILADNKILICNFAKGKIGEDTSSLFGVSVLTKLQLAAYRRQNLDQEQRQPFYLYVDEFQNFATPSFMQLLSEARKYKLFLTMAEQSPSQQDKLSMVSTILSNVGTTVCFRSGSPLDEQLLLPLFSPHINKGELLNLPSFHFFIRIAAMTAHEPLSGVTLLLDDNGSKDTAKAVVEASRKQYAIKYVEPKKNPTATNKLAKHAKLTNKSRPKSHMKRAVRSTNRSIVKKDNYEN